MSSVFICTICGEPDEDPYRHDLGDADADDIGTATCPSCGETASARCSWGTGGHGWFVCPSGHGFEGFGT